MRSSKPWLYAGVRAFDAAAGAVARAARATPPTRPARILVSNIGHLGDALLALGVPGALRRPFPDAHVDVLVSREGSALFQGHPDVDTIHRLEPALLARRGGPLSRVVAATRAARATAPALADARYDLALELRSYVPNSIATLARARPGCLAGLGTGGLRFLLDLEVEHLDGEHELERFARVIRAVGGPAAAGIDAAALAPSVGHLLARPGTAPPASGPYAVLHPGTRRRKRWRASSWAAVARALHAEGDEVLVTGNRAERPWLESVFRSTPARVVAGDTDLPGLARLCAGARRFVGTDSFPAHLAAAAGTPRVVVVWNRFADPREWAPLGRGRIRILPPDAGPAPVLAAAGGAG